MEYPSKYSLKRTFLLSNSQDLHFNRRLVQPSCSCFPSPMTVPSATVSTCTSESDSDENKRNPCSHIHHNSVRRCPQQRQEGKTSFYNYCVCKVFQRIGKTVTFQQLDHRKCNASNDSKKEENDLPTVQGSAYTSAHCACKASTKQRG